MNDVGLCHSSAVSICETREILHRMLGHSAPNLRGTMVNYHHSLRTDRTRLDKILQILQLIKSNLMNVLNIFSFFSLCPDCSRKEHKDGENPPSDDS